MFNFYGTWNLPFIVFLVPNLPAVILIQSYANCQVDLQYNCSSRNRNHVLRRFLPNLKLLITIYATNALTNHNLTLPMDVDAVMKQNFVYTECYSQASTDFTERSLLFTLNVLLRDIY